MSTMSEIDTQEEMDRLADELEQFATERAEFDEAVQKAGNDPYYESDIEQFKDDDRLDSLHTLFETVDLEVDYQIPPEDLLPGAQPMDWA